MMTDQPTPLPTSERTPELVLLDMLKKVRDGEVSCLVVVYEDMTSKVGWEPSTEVNVLQMHFWGGMLSDSALRLSAGAYEYDLEEDGDAD